MNPFVVGSSEFSTLLFGSPLENGDEITTTNGVNIPVSQYYTIVNVDIPARCVGRYVADNNYERSDGTAGTSW